MKKYKHKLYHPVVYRMPEPGHVIKEMPLEQGLELLMEEEDYYPGDQHKTELMCTRLRKVFYDSYICSAYIIRGARAISGRYGIGLTAAPYSQPLHSPSLLGYRYGNKFIHLPSNRVGIYKSDDRLYPDRAGQVPEICEPDKQPFLLAEGFYCNIGHVFYGLDAYRHLAPVCPLPDVLMWMRKLFPSVDSNVDFATWLGNLAKAAGDYLMGVQANKDRRRTPEQDDDERSVPVSDLLGYIDAYVIRQNYPTTVGSGKRITEILSEYYLGEGKAKELREHRCSIFCSSVGLKAWDGTRFAQEGKWLKYYKKQLRNATIFNVLAQLGLKKGAWTALKIRLRFYEKELDLDLLLHTLLELLKAEIKKEPAIKRDKPNRHNRTHRA